MNANCSVTAIEQPIHANEHYSLSINTTISKILLTVV